MNPSRLRQSCNSSSRPSPAKRDASRDPDNVPAKAGIQTPNDVIELHWIPDIRFWRIPE